MVAENSLGAGALLRLQMDQRVLEDSRYLGI